MQVDGSPSSTVCSSVIALICLVLVGGCAGATTTDSMDNKTPQQAAADFLPQLEQAIAGLPIQRDAFKVRANRCEGAQGETRDDLFYIWVGLRGDARDGDASGLIEIAHTRWQAQGWEIGRFRKLDNGGMNLAAKDPATGNTYMLDSGFKNAPASALAGFFNTPCMRSPDGKVAFGRLQPSD